jgi:hypothetical protein
MAANEAIQAILIINSSLRAISDKAKSVQKSTTNLVLSRVKASQWDDAAKKLPGLCSAFEQLSALSYIISSVAVVKDHISELLSSRTCPAAYVGAVAPLCYLNKEKLVKIEGLPKLVDQILTKAWSRDEIERLSRSPTIPESLIHINPRDTFSHEELHVLTHRIQDEQGSIDFRWFYEKFPLGSPEQNQEKRQIHLLDRHISLSGSISAPAPSAISDSPPRHSSESHVRDDLPQLRRFSEADYAQMVQYVDQSLKRWNTWTYQLPNS